MNDDIAPSEPPASPEKTPEPAASPSPSSEPVSAIPPPLESSLTTEPAANTAETAASPPAISPDGPPPPVASEAPPVSPPAPAEPVSHPILFHGRTDEFFRIWIVNTLLTFLTLGVFFSWAKVRKRRYLRGSTELLGHRFDYRANPVRLLIGHIVVLLLFLGYSVFGVVYPTVRFGVIAIAIVLLPWIVVRSFSFNAHNTVYRGLRFRFNPSLSAALVVYLLEPLLLIVTLGLYYPAWQRSKRNYAVNNHRFGDAYFKFDGGAGRFYSTYFLAGLIVLAAATIGGVFVGVWVVKHRGIQPNFVQLIPFFIVYGFGFYVGQQIIYARLFNHIWNHTQLDDHRFRGRLDTGRWLGLQLANLGAILISVGLLYPWALIRAQRYAASCLEFIPAGSVDKIQRMGGTAGSATGDMAAEFIGVDFGL